MCLYMRMQIYANWSKSIRTGAVKKQLQHLSILHLISFWIHTHYPASFSLMEAHLELLSFFKHSEQLFRRISWYFLSMLFLSSRNWFFSNAKRHRERRDLGNMMLVQPGKYSSWPKLATQAMITEDVLRWQHLYTSFYHAVI